MTVSAIPPPTSHKRPFGEVEPSELKEAPDAKKYFEAVSLGDVKLWKNLVHLEHGSKRYLSYDWSKCSPPLKAETLLEISFLISRSETHNDLKERIKPLVENLPSIELGRLHKIAPLISGRDGIAMRALLYPHLYHCKPAEVKQIPSHAEVIEQFVDYLIQLKDIPMAKMESLLKDHGFEIQANTTWERVLTTYRKGQQRHRGGLEVMFCPYFFQEGCLNTQFSPHILSHRVGGLKVKQVESKPFPKLQFESCHPNFAIKTSAPLFPIWYAFCQSKLGVYLPKNWPRVQLQDYKPLLQAVELLRLECSAGVSQ